MTIVRAPSCHLRNIVYNVVYNVVYSSPARLSILCYNCNYKTKSKYLFQYFYLDHLLQLSTAQKVPTTPSSTSTSTEKTTTQGNGSQQVHC